MFSQRKQHELGASSAPYLDPERTLLSCHILSRSHKQNQAPDIWSTRENTWKGRQEVRSLVGRGWVTTGLPEREVVHAGPRGSRGPSKHLLPLRFPVPEARQGASPLGGPSVPRPKRSQHIPIASPPLSGSLAGRGRRAAPSPPEDGEEAGRGLGTSGTQSGTG